MSSADENIVKLFIETHIEMIDALDFEGLYESAKSQWRSDVRLIGKLTALLYEADIDPLVYMKSVPQTMFIHVKNLDKIFKIPDGVEMLLGYSFAYTGFDEVILPNSLDTILNNVFANSEIKRITIPSNVDRLSAAVFSHCEKLTDVTLPRNMTKIRPRCFSNCIALERLNLPESLLTISEEMFYNCSSLKKIHIPHSVQEIEYMAFYNCALLRDITYEGTIEEWKKLNFGVHVWHNVPARTVLCSDGRTKLRVEF